MAILNASMRTNLLSLQNTQKMMDTTQQRLSTGLKVNSAIDNPNSYFTASNLNNRAADLDALLDNMGQAVQTVKAADEGIKSITKLVQQLKSVANTISEKESADPTGYTYAGSTEEDSVNLIVAQIDELAGDASYKGVNLLKAGTTLTVKFNETGDSKIDIAGQDATTATTGLDLAALTFGDETEINASIDKIDAAIGKLRTMSSDFSNAYSIVQNREEFTENLVNVLTEGAGKLVDADMNEEAANMLALQTRQQLGVNALSLASQSAQSVLKLF